MGFLPKLLTSPSLSAALMLNSSISMIAVKAAHNVAFLEIEKQAAQSPFGPEPEVTHDPMDIRTLDSGLHWNKDSNGVARIYYTTDAPASKSSKEGATDFMPLNPQQAALVDTIFDQATAVYNLELIRLKPGDAGYDNPALVTVNVADLSKATSDVDVRGMNSTVNISGYATYPNNQTGGAIVLSKTAMEYPSVENTAGHIVLHELGHLLGLKHPFETSPNQVVLDTKHDSQDLTQMSYHEGEHSRSSAGGGAPGFQLLDDAALTQMYGKRERTADIALSLGESLLGNLTITDPNITTLLPGVELNALWVDAASGLEHVTTVGFNRTRWIGADVQVDNIAGGRLSDVLLGNPRDNLIVGSSGGDVLSGISGIDVYKGGLSTSQQGRFEAGEFPADGGDVFLPNRSGQVTILDFQPGVDTLALLPGMDFEDVKHREENGNLALSFGEGSQMVLEGVTSIDDVRLVNAEGWTQDGSTLMIYGLMPQEQITLYAFNPDKQEIIIGAGINYADAEVTHDNADSTALLTFQRSDGRNIQLFMPHTEAIAQHLFISADDTGERFQNIEAGKTYKHYGEGAIDLSEGITKVTLISDGASPHVVFALENAQGETAVVEFMDHASPPDLRLKNRDDAHYAVAVYDPENNVSFFGSASEHLELIVQGENAGKDYPISAFDAEYFNEKQPAADHIDFSTFDSIKDRIILCEQVTSTEGITVDDYGNKGIVIKIPAQAETMMEEVDFIHSITLYNAREDDIARINIINQNGQRVSVEGIAIQTIAEDNPVKGWAEKITAEKNTPERGEGR